ncbi:MAG: riboflavin biosynthesis protein RibF [Planctomycetota bacterium]|jgi:riboflavin kinase/FMN adenylyltransferase
MQAQKHTRGFSSWRRRCFGEMKLSFRVIIGRVRMPGMIERLIQGLEAVGEKLRGCVLTVGNFDGVHVGHRRILETARALGEAEGSRVVVLTFDPPPDLVLRPADKPQRLTPHDEKCRLLLAAGADHVVKALSERKLLAMTAEEFVHLVILQRFAPRHLVEGENFFFGRGRSGNIDTLRLTGLRAGYVLHVVEPVLVELPEGPRRISSTLVRRLIAAGRIEDANLCLGRDFALYGRVLAGRGRGRFLEYPTANVNPGEQICPADGVYAGTAAVAGQRTAAAISIGRKTTFGPGQDRCVEAFLLNARGDYYDEKMALGFKRRLRDQRQFGSAEDLKAQIAKDVERVREICG